MKVSELRTALEHFDDDDEVFFTYNYGDHWRTTVAKSVARVDEGEVTWSDYHTMHRVCDEDGERDSDPNVAHFAVLLS